MTLRYSQDCSDHWSYYCLIQAYCTLLSGLVLCALSLVVVSVQKHHAVSFDQTVVLVGRQVDREIPVSFLQNHRREIPRKSVK
jgi:hypothetical protein